MNDGAEPSPTAPEALPAGVVSPASASATPISATESATATASSPASDEVAPATLRRRASLRQTSAPAVAATVALVLFSVFIGLYGPRLGNRQQLPGGTTLVELAQAIEPRHAQRVIEAAQQGMDGLRPLRRAGGTDALGLEARAELEKSRIAAEEAVVARSGFPIVLPRPPAHRVLWGEPERVRLPGAGGVLAFCTLMPEARGVSSPSYATILFLEDEDRFTVFDAYARPRAMPEGEVFSVAARASAQGSDGRSADPEGAAAIRIFRSGALVVAVQASDPDVADEFTRQLESMAARIGVGGMVQPGPALGGSR